MHLTNRLFAGAKPLLAGTVQHHTSQLIIHTPFPPNAWPARLETLSPLFKEIQVSAQSLGCLVNFSWDPALPPPSETKPQESYAATLYRASKSAMTMHVNQGSVPALLDLLSSPERPTVTAEHKSVVNSTAIDEKHVYICTHGSRDCRCGDTGGKVFQALEDLLREQEHQSEQAKRIRVRQVAHVGGHKYVERTEILGRGTDIFSLFRYAANALVFPQGDWSAPFFPRAQLIH